MFGAESSIRTAGLRRSRHQKQTESNTEGTEYTESGEMVARGIKIDAPTRRGKRRAGG
jgi:hypothetical protein